jgi:hypothetical protein
MKVLGIDIGPKRTAFCAIEFSESNVECIQTQCVVSNVEDKKIENKSVTSKVEDKKIEKVFFWELMSPKDYQITCKNCQKIAHWKNCNDEYVCKKHGGEISVTPDFCDRFIHYLDTKIFPLKVDVVCPEVQVSSKNNIIYFIFKMWCLGIPEIKFCPVNSKTKVTWIPNVKPTSEFNAVYRNRGKRYNYLKNEMVKLVTAKFNEPHLKEWYSYFHSLEKKDDIAEAYLNAAHYIC